MVAPGPSTALLRRSAPLRMTNILVTLIDMTRRADGAGLDRDRAALDHSVRDFTDHLLEEITEMRAAPIIGGRNVADTIGMGAELITFPK